MYLRNDYLRTAFDMFDKDGSGKIDADEICKILDGEEMSVSLTKEKIIAYINDIDQDGDGEIDFDEFCEMMAKCETLQL